MTKRKKHKKKKSYSSVFPVLYPSRLGTPYGYSPGSKNSSGGSRPGGVTMGGRGGMGAGGGPMGAGGGTGMGGAAGGSGGAGESVHIKPSRARVMHEMKRALGLLEYFNDTPGVLVGGYAIPSFGAVTMRTGGPTLGGPGFQYDGDGEGGVFNIQKSPGLGFSTEKGWTVWQKAVEITNSDKTLSKNAILFRAMAKAGVHRGQIDAAEFRLLEMGIEWYLSGAGAASAERDGENA